MSERLVAKSEPEMGLSQVRIEPDRLLKRQNRLGVLVVSVHFLAFFKQLAGPRAVPG